MQISWHTPPDRTAASKSGHPKQTLLSPLPPLYCTDAINHSSCFPYPTPVQSAPSSLAGNQDIAQTSLTTNKLSTCTEGQVPSTCYISHLPHTVSPSPSFPSPGGLMSVLGFYHCLSAHSDGTPQIPLLFSSLPVNYFLLLSPNFPTLQLSSPASYFLLISSPCPLSEFLHGNRQLWKLLRQPSHCRSTEL